ncbi:MAG: flagellar motor protein MotB [Burkholderiales bacterium]
MAGAEKKLQPIIIKKIKKGGHGHHGGAWKIAYADFVTAMMAFFLLMWLLGSTTKGDLRGIADYFNTPLQVAMAGGSGSGDSSSVLRGGGEDLTRTVGQVKRGNNDGEKKTYTVKAMAADMQKIADEEAKLIKKRIEQSLERNPRLRDVKSQVKMDVTSDGLRIQIVDDKNRPMFDSGSTLVKPYMRELLSEIAKVLNDVDSRITLSGHTDSSPFSGGDRGYSNWELSADRANASRRELVAGGIAENKILRVVGLAAIVPYEPANPDAPVNRRISIVVMNQLAEMRLLTGNELQAGDLEAFEKVLIDAGRLPAPAPAAEVPQQTEGAAQDPTASKR